MGSELESGTSVSGDNALDARCGIESVTIRWLEAGTLGGSIFCAPEVVPYKAGVAILLGEDRVGNVGKEIVFTVKCDCYIHVRKREFKKITYTWS